MYIEHVPNRNSPPAVLLRESYRDGNTVKKRTLANLSSLPAEVIEGLKVLLRGGVAVSAADEAFVIERSLPHGHVAAVLGAARACGAEQWFASAPAALRSVVMALLVARVVSPASKLATHRMLRDETAAHSLSRLLKLGDVELEQVYAALDWLGEAQEGIEKRLARQHLSGSTLVLYDLTSTWVTGRCCELAAHGYSRDGKRDDPQIVFGLVCTPEGCPVAVEVFAGNTADPATVASQVDKLKNRYGIEKLAWVGDRGMLTQARIDTVLRPAGLDWVSSLRAPQMAALAREKGPFQPSLFDERNLLEVTSEAFPGERLIVCRNPLLAEERSRKREALLQATEAELMKITDATTRARNRLKGTEEIALRVGRVIDHFRMGKHFELNITDSSFTWERKAEQIQQEAALDGLYVVRTSLPATDLPAEAAVTAYKGLAVVERAFRSLKTVDLQVRPVFHWNAARVRAHVFLCMLAYYVEWHMREKLKPMLFDDEYVELARAARPSPVAKARRSDQAKIKDATRLGEDGLPVHSFRTLLDDLATLAYNVCHTPLNPQAKIIMITRPTPVQEKAFRLLNVSPVACTQ
ncbi:IS1634 family transposase [Cupriavidus sp. CV2]|uniref:IS1634 family transposase n=1 Tax=Cupriavidus ulmosensis TaxID=3065913 RepID=UPI00296B2EAD|nr:IS1634 family transposase [Cupriavidus sp. CV2]MDW3689215.1 IS1634 family transposase [Cupriavidus sp. CV2]